MEVLLGSKWRCVGLAPAGFEESRETGERIADGFHRNGQLSDGKRLFLCEECTRPKLGNEVDLLSRFQEMRGRKMEPVLMRRLILDV